MHDSVARGGGRRSASGLQLGGRVCIMLTVMLELGLGPEFGCDHSPALVRVRGNHGGPTRGGHRGVRDSSWLPTVSLGG